jgi:hypothetical protein
LPFEVLNRTGFRVRLRVNDIPSRILFHLGAPACLHGIRAQYSARGHCAEVPMLNVLIFTRPSLGIQRPDCVSF